MFSLSFLLGSDNLLNNNTWTLGCVLLIAVILATLIERLTGRRNTASPRKEKPTEESSLPNGEYVMSPKRLYELREPVGSGDLCQVHRAESEGNHYLLKMSFGSDGRELLAKEFSILEQLQRKAGTQVYGEYFPKPVESFSAKGRNISAFEWHDGLFTAEQILDRHHRGLDGRHLGWMFNRVLEALGFVHQQGWIHGAVVPPHLLFHAENHGLQLVGWIHAEKENTALRVAPERFKDWYPPECQKKHPATPSVDIYLAARSLIYLAGGDPVGNWMPAHIPAKLTQFVKGCLLESPRMRSQDAWKVRQEFGELLEGLYGPPAFHSLDMS